MMLRSRYGGRVKTPVFQNAKMCFEPGSGEGGEVRAKGGALLATGDCFVLGSVDVPGIERYSIAPDLSST